jgi:serine/threonine protein kinase
MSLESQLRNDPIVQYVALLAHHYKESYRVTATETWWHFTPTNLLDKPKQGWKLHISALPIHAVALLEKVSDSLLERAVQWKVCASITQHIQLFSPPSPMSQVGKFLTVYPQNEQQAAELAALLHEKTSQFTGPIIPSDHRYAEGSQVYYRYGAFEDQAFYDPDTSMKKPYILTPEGLRMEDQRQVGKSYPTWANNPFPVTHAARPMPSRSHGLFGKELHVKGLLRQTAKGGVYVVAQGSETFILKEARFGACPDMSGRDARDRLVNEWTILKELAELGIAPRPVELFDAEQNRYLLMEHLVGYDLRTHLTKANYLGGHRPEYLRELCLGAQDLIQKCHSLGIILRDFSPNNILVAPDGCKLIDFELAYLANSTDKPFSGFTTGYVPLGSEHLERITAEYDFYALGAVLFFILTGFDPYLGPGEDIMSRKGNLLSLFMADPTLSDLAEMALHYLTWPPQPRPHSPPSFQSHTGLEVLPFGWDDLKENVILVADDLYETANWQASSWLWQEYAHTSLLHPASFQAGTAGVAYFFCDVARAVNDPKYYTYAQRVIDWTCAAHPFDVSETPPGLYFGYSSIPLIQVTIAEGLQDLAYQKQALQLANRIATVSPAQLDLTHGAAGIGLMHLELYRCTKDERQLHYAMKQAQNIIETIEEDLAGNIMWKVGNAYMWGFAHGVAGIAYFLLEMYAQTGKPQFKEVSERAGKTLQQVALECCDKRGLTWAKGQGDQSVIWSHWCNGAAGVGTFFLYASRILQHADFAQTALAAALAIKATRGVKSTTQCHGLAGDGDYLLQAGRLLGNPEMEETARHYAHRIWALRLHESGKAGWLWPTEISLAPAPHYMIGYCGIYAFLLRIFLPELRRPFLGSKV